MSMRCLTFLLVLACLAWPAKADTSLDAAQAAYDSGDHVRAASLLLPLAESGQARAQHLLALLYHHGSGVPEDDARAVHWARRSAERGDPEAMLTLAYLHLLGYAGGDDREEADREGARWLHRAARAGHAEAQYSLGLLFLAGKGVRQDPAQASTWMAQAARGGHAGARGFFDPRRMHGVH